MGKRKFKYTKGKIITAAIYALAIIMFEHPNTLYFIVPGALLVGAYFYLLTFKKYNRNFLKVKDHLFIASTIRYWRLQNKIILGFVLFFSFAILSDSTSNPILKELTNLSITGFFFYIIGLGLRWLYLIIKALILNIKPTNYIEPIEEVDNMQWYEFEQFLAPIFRNYGYYVEVTKRTGDFGGDLIIKMKKEKGVVQAKLLGDGYKVGVEAVNEVVGAAGYYCATKKIVITNRYFTDPAKVSAKRNGVTLLDRDDLIRMINQYNDNQIRLSKQKQPIEI